MTGIKFPYKSPRRPPYLPQTPLRTKMDLLMVHGGTRDPTPLNHKLLQSGVHKALGTLPDQLEGSIAVHVSDETIELFYKVNQFEEFKVFF